MEERGGRESSGECCARSLSPSLYSLLSQLSLSLSLSRARARSLSLSLWGGERGERVFRLVLLAPHTLNHRHTCVYYLSLGRRKYLLFAYRPDSSLAPSLPISLSSLTSSIPHALFPLSSVLRNFLINILPLPPRTLPSLGLSMGRWMQ